MAHVFTRDDRPALAAILVIATVSLVPFWIVDVLPAIDYPAHLARLHLLTEALAGRPIDPHYRIEPALLPNLAIDLTVPPLALLLGVEPAFRVVISIVAVLPLLGTALLQKALIGRVGLGAVLAGAFVFNRPLVFGFYNAAAGGGLLLVALAAWIGLAERRRLRLAVMLVLTSLVWLAHLLPFLLLGLLIGLWEGEAALRRSGGRGRRMFLAAAEIGVAFLPGLLALAATRAAGPGGPTVFTGTDGLHALFDAAADGGRLAPALWLLLPTYLFFFASWREGRLRIAPRARGLVVALLLLTLAAPLSIAGGTVVPPRFATLFWFVLAAASAFAWSRRVERGVVAAVIAAATIQAATVGWAWRERARDAGEFRAALAEVAPKGARLVPIDSQDTVTAAYRLHLADFVVIDADGLSPIFFTLPGQQIVRRIDAERDLGANVTFEGSPAPIDEFLAADDDFARRPPIVRRDWPWLARWSCRFDLAVHFHDDPARLPPDPRLEPLRSGRIFDLYRIHPAAHCGATP